MAWVEFADKAAFVAYHDRACADQGIPRPGQNTASGKDALDAQWTTAWVAPIDDGGTLKAFVGVDEVAAYGLMPTVAPVVTMEDPPLKLSWEAECEKQLPETWSGKPVSKVSVVVKDG